MCDGEGYEINPAQTAESSQHFFTKLVLAAPARGFPSLLIALVAQVWAEGLPTANAVIKNARLAISLLLSLIGLQVAKSLNDSIPQI